MLRETDIVLIDDSPTQAERIASFMSDFNINISIATDSRQGLRLIMADLPDAVVLDLNMPHINGFQLCRRIKHNPETKHIHIIIVSSSCSEEDIAEGKSVGAEHFLYKDSNLATNLINILYTLQLDV